MAKKNSYFGKQLEKSGGIREDLPRPIVSDEKRQEFEAGKIILIDKPLHWTSFDVIRKLRSSLKLKKIGHAGTLDPLATGLLIICTGKFTKKINDYMAQEKEYTGTITLGSTTPTYDLESLPENHQAYDHLQPNQINEAAQSFTGNIMQKPPIYAAIKKDGEAMYQLARRGEDVDLVARPIQIYNFDITEITLPLLHFRVRCSTGTYIRSLAHDMGQTLGCGAHLSSLRRTAIGEIPVTEALTLKDFLLSLEG